MLWNAKTIDPLNVFITPTVRGPRFDWMIGEADGLALICHKNQSLIC